MVLVLHARAVRGSVRPSPCHAVEPEFKGEGPSGLANELSTVSRCQNRGLEEGPVSRGRTRQAAHDMPSMLCRLARCGTMHSPSMGGSNARRGRWESLKGGLGKLLPTWHSGRPALQLASRVASLHIPERPVGTVPQGPGKTKPISGAVLAPTLPFACRLLTLTSAACFQSFFPRPIYSSAPYLVPSTTIQTCI